MKFKRVVLVALALFLGVLAACGSDDNETSSVDVTESDNFNKEGFPIVDEKITLNFMTGRPPTTADDYNDVLIWKEYEEMTNIHIDWGLVPREGIEERRNLALVGEGLPDAFYRTWMPNEDLARYGDQGVIVDLTDLIEEYMPNLTAMLDKYPEIRKGITFPDGGIYGLPTIYDPDFTSLIVGAKFWIRQDWLDQLDMDIPETTDEFYEYLKAVKETDLNGNGEHDEIPYGGTSINGLRNYLAGAFGIMNKGRLHAYIDEDPDTGDVRFFPISDGYRQMLEYLNKLFEEGLIHESIYTIEENQSYSLGAEGLYGSVVVQSPYTLYGAEDGTYVGMPALEGPEGHKMVSHVGSPLAHVGGFVVTNENEHIPETLRWMDYFYTDEGTTMFFMGIEGETYEVTDDGSVEYLDHIQNSPEGLTLEQELSKYVIYLGGGYPGMVMEDSFKGSESLPSAVEAAAKLEDYMIDEVWPRFTFTADENRRLAGIQGDLHKYVNEMQDKFITGAEPLSKWDEYVEEIENMRLDEYLEIMQAALDRYNSN